MAILYDMVVAKTCVWCREVKLLVTRAIFQWKSTKTMIHHVTQNSEVSVHSAIFPPKSIAKVS